MTVRATAMLLDAPRAPLREAEVAIPEPGPNELLVRVHACAVCRTDLHIADGELVAPRLPLVPGHEIVGTVQAVGTSVPADRLGERVGIPWLGWTCGECVWCTSGRENLCPRARFTGLDIDGGYATHTLADQRYALPITLSTTDVEVAPLLCAGLIGYRAYRMAGDAEMLGLYGFGAAAHIIAQVAVADGRRVFAFTRPGDVEGQDFARSLGAAWAGGSDASPPEPQDAAIIFAPVGALVPAALRHVKPAGVVVCAGIHMSDIPSFPYALLWQERMVRSVANLTRADGTAFMSLASRLPIRTETKTYPLAAANEALTDLRDGRVQGAAVLVP